MLVTLKKIKLTKSVIEQLQYVDIRSIKNYKILGYVIIPKKESKVIIDLGCEVYRWSKHIVEAEPVQQNCQYPDPNLQNSWVFENRTKINYKCFDRSESSYSPNFDENKNIELLNEVKKYILEVQKAGQIFY